ncbi:MAG: MEDS domain-containing protein [Chitinispirillaceae bacterium]|nr:MEDS domain-containing protein [Chitinispirillaceae bacterium]
MNNANPARQSGIDAVGPLPWGSHFCQFYDTTEDLIDTHVPYFRAGLETNEFCMWVTSQPLKTGTAKAPISSTAIICSGFSESRPSGRLPEPIDESESGARKFSMKNTGRRIVERRTAARTFRSISHLLSK